MEAVLMGQKTGPADLIMALLTISHRLRNNLFRGLKGIKDLNDQRENLAVACAALAGVMEFLKAWVSARLPVEIMRARRP